MAINGIVNSLNSKMRMSGMSSGLDIDSMVKQIMASQTAKVDKLMQKRELSLWKADSYREVTSTLKGFYNEYFDILSTKNLKNESSFSSFTSSYADNTSSEYVKVTPNAESTTGTYSITDVKTATAAAITSGVSATKTVEGSAVTDMTVATINSSNNNNTFVFTLNNKTVQFTLNDSGTLDTVAKFQTELQSKINDAFGTNKITVDATGGKFSFNAVRTTDVFSIGSGGTANAVLGLPSANLSNKIDLAAKLFDIKDRLSNVLTATGTDGDISFEINGKTFSFNSKDVSINDIMAEVNADTTINASIEYNLTTNSFKIESKSIGITDELTVSDNTGNIMSSLGLSGTDNGTDASLKLDGLEIVRSSNSFTYNGLIFNINKDTEVGADAIKVNVEKDLSKTIDLIKSFVGKYNDMVDKLNTKLGEKKYSDYMPLTEEQKSVMTEDQIEKWDAKAKSGLLKGDSIVSSILSKLRSSLYDSVDGVGLSMYSIGITTSSDYSQKGKLIIDETKLNEVLSSNPEGVTQLFASNSDKSYYDAMNDSSLKTERYNESGLAQRFSDIIQDAIRTSADNDGKKGTLLEKAGVVGDRSEYSNLLYKEVSDFDKAVTDMNTKLVAKENALYAKFTAMETALNKMNSQSSWLSQQFGGGS